ncbi:MAG: porin [Thiobacillus sp.]|nr:porin [Thiobacillus sp.]
MKKSLIALAVAGVVSAPAFAATSNVDVYGRMSFSVDFADTNEATGDSDDLVTGRDNVSRIGFKGSEDLGGGLSAIWQIEEALNANASAFSHRNTFVGLSSKTMGTVILGRHDTPYKMATGALDPFADTVGDYNTVIGTTGGTTAAGVTPVTTIYDNRAGQTVAYVSPNFTGFSFAAAYVGVKDVETGAENDTNAYSLMGKYENGPLFASVAYETFAGGPAATFGGSTTTTDTDAWKVGVGYKFGNAKLAAVYESIDDEAAGSAISRDAWYVSGVYTMGNIDLKAAYGLAEDGDSAADTEFDYWAIGADYNLSKRTKLFAVYATVENAATTTATLSTSGLTAATTGGQDVDVLSIGITHTF